MLHVLNGDSLAHSSKESGIAGEFMTCRDALIAGPAPGGLSPLEWRRTRAQHLKEAYGADPEACERDLQEQEELLSCSAKEDEIVFWFDPDLFCQLNFISLLGRLHWHKNRPLIFLAPMDNPLSASGALKGFGGLEPAELTRFFTSRRRLNDAELKAAGAAWAAYQAETPRALQELLSQDDFPLPELRNAFLLHLQRFPSARNGLGRIETRHYA